MASKRSDDIGVITVNADYKKLGKNIPNVGPTYSTNNISVVIGATVHNTQLTLVITNTIAIWLNILNDRQLNFQGSRHEFHCICQTKIQVFRLCIP
jgi:hypothetical protein